MSRRLNLDDFVAEKLAWNQRVLHDSRISAAARMVASLIAHDLNVTRGGAWRGQKSMSALAGFSERHLRRLLKELEQASYIEIEGGRGRGLTNLYCATFPDDDEVTEKRTPASDQAPEKRTSASGQRFEKRTPMSDQRPEKRTSASRKADIRVRQSLYEPIKEFTPPRQVASPRRARPGPFEAPDIRNEIVGIAGEAAAISYLDPATWDAAANRIICRSQTGFTRLRALAGRALETRGVTIVWEPVSYAQAA